MVAPVDCEEAAAGIHVPDPGCGRACCDDPAVIGAESRAVDLGVGARKSPEQPTRSGIPDPRLVVAARCDDVTAVVAERGGRDQITVTGQRRGDLLAALDVPDACDRVRSCGHQPSAVGTEGCCEHPGAHGPQRFLPVDVPDASAAVLADDCQAPPVKAE